MGTRSDTIVRREVPFDAEPPSYTVAGDGRGAPGRCVPYGGRTWRQANLEPASGRWAWRLWSLTVEAEPEELSVTARAWDDTGATTGCHFGIRGIRRQRLGELSPFDSRIKS